MKIIFDIREDEKGKPYVANTTITFDKGDTATGRQCLFAVLEDIIDSVKHEQP